MIEQVSNGSSTVIVPESLTHTTELLQRCQGGESDAKAELIARFLPRIQRWARGRLPMHGRDLVETDDLVQITFLRTLNRLEEFESQRPGAFLGYLRTVLLNLVREELRRSSKRPMMMSLGNAAPAEQPSQIELSIGREQLMHYERCLSKLPERKRLAVMMRVEFQMEFSEIASELNCPSPNAARMLVSRALAKLAENLDTT